MPPSMPKWLLYLLVGIVAIAAGFAIYASIRSIRNARKARALIDSGQVQVRITDEDKAFIATELRKAAG